MTFDNSRSIPFASYRPESVWNCFGLNIRVYSSVKHRLSVLCFDNIRIDVDDGFMRFMSSEIKICFFQAVILVVYRNFLKEFFCIWNCRWHPAFLHITGLKLLCERKGLLLWKPSSNYEMTGTFGKKVQLRANLQIFCCIRASINFAQGADHKKQIMS